MDKPMVIIDGQKYTPENPKCAVWRTVMELEDNMSDVPVTEIVDRMASAIALAFGRNEVTAEKVIDQVNVDDIRPLFKTVFLWLLDLFVSKAKQLPNAETETAD